MYYNNTVNKIDGTIEKHFDDLEIFLGKKGPTICPPPPPTETFQFCQIIFTDINISENIQFIQL